MATDRDLQEWALRGVEGVQFVVLHVEPPRPREGLTVYADGTDWNPGSGAGLYVYDGANWVAL